VTYRAADGRPLVAPVWFVIEEGRLVFNTGKDTAKGRALARDPRVAVCVDLEQPPFAYVQVQGVAEFSEDPADLVTTATAIGARYMGADLAEEFGRRNGVPGELMNRLDPRPGGLTSARQPLTLRHQALVSVGTRGAAYARDSCYGTWPLPWTPTCT
jgi:PPOX class probable F420-dependent enzyme